VIASPSITALPFSGSLVIAEIDKVSPSLSLSFANTSIEIDALLVVVAVSAADAGGVLVAVCGGGGGVEFVSGVSFELPPHPLNPAAKRAETIKVLLNFI
jgi:hypothetical protein